MPWKLRAAALFAVAAGIAFITPRALTQTRAGSPAQPPNTGTNQYIDAAVCAGCHADKAAGFAKTGMGRSFYRLTPKTAVETFGKPFYHAASDTYLEMIGRGGKYYQRRWQKGFDGSETNVDEKQVDFVIGSGNHGRSYLHLTERGTLQELPLGWYSEKGGYWAMAPGFDRQDYPGSTRVVTYECMFCHNAYPRIPAGHDEPGSTPQFIPSSIREGIDCQRCHGPGERHVMTAARAGATAAEIRAAIINPKRLSADREAEVCLECHLETTTVTLPHDIRKLDRAPFSYRPGQPLGDFRLTFDRQGGMGDSFEVAYAAYRMRDSQCFLKSNGSMRCTTCHDPHNIPRGAEATAHYNGICRDCHAASGTAGTAAARFKPMPASAPHTASANCISCHMPKRRTEDAVYIVMTDHLIRARQPAGDPTAPLSERQEASTPPYRGEVVPYYPKNMASTTTPAPRKEEEASLYGALSQIIERSNLAGGIPLMESLLGKYRPQRADYYADLGEALDHAGDPAKGLTYYEEAAQHAPDSALILRQLGSAQMEAGQLPKAEATLRRVVTIAPDDGGAWGMLAQVLWREGRAADATADFRKGISLDPELPELHNSLATLLLAAGDKDGAEKEFREAMRIEPTLPQVRMNLASVLASRGVEPAISEAKYHFEQSIRLKPDYAEARLNYARLLTSLQETAEAEKQAQASVEEDGNVAPARELYGSILGAKGDMDGAIRELQAAVKLQPDFWRAHYELGIALGRNRDYAAAEEQLKLAAQGNDPNTKAAAQDLLQKLGK